MLNNPDSFCTKGTREFIFGMGQTSPLPITELPEIAIIGRSNVGKSSLINSILHKDIAFVSKTPGRTRQLNFYSINKALYIVDMPGYGYASAGKSDIQNWGSTVIRYLEDSKALQFLMILIDSRRGIMKIDIEALHIMGELGIACRLILTKADELSAKQLEITKQSLLDFVFEHPFISPEIIVSSSRFGTGLTELRRLLFANSTLKSTYKQGNSQS